ncbi:MAG: hemolysin family protein [Thermoanaerobaculales bacterium]|nr:hemolysin family protein [Thermoanaerobaculales bacterium]
MTADLAGWLVHPVTLSLAGLMFGVLVLLTEILLRRLSYLGNVRFQGVVDDHEPLLALGEEEQVDLSNVVTALRWTQIVFLAFLWLLLFVFSDLPFVTAAAIAVAVPIVAAIVAQWPLGTVGEDGVARLLRVLKPVIVPFASLSRLGASQLSEAADDDEEDASDREIRAFLDVGEAAGIIEGEEGEILESLVDFFDTTVREVMTPRTEMVVVSETSSWEELLETFAKTHKSRVPVFRETIDDIIGVVNVKNLVKDLTGGGRPPVRDLFLECIVVPESKELGPLLKEFQEKHQQMAIVVDEYGGTAGLVTLEDILEEIVGEIQDEMDPAQPPELEEVEPGVFRLQGRAPVEVLEELFDLELDEEDVDTVGGLVFSRFGTVPEAGSEVLAKQEELHFVVDEMDGRRIVSVMVRRTREVGSE